jgi:acyl phosphate:glycerol-3-phosphate acyltransferase
VSLWLLVFLLATHTQRLSRPRTDLDSASVIAKGRLAPPAVVSLAYAAGSVPFAQLVANLKHTTDLRRHGVGTVSASGLKDVAGVGPLIAAGVLDVAKGTLGPLLARPAHRPTLAAVAGAAAVVGHNWSPLLRGAGGRGISPAMGALLVIAPEGAAVLLGGLIAGRLARQTALGALVADLALVPVLARTRGCTGATVGAAVLVPMLAKRLLGNAPAATPNTYLWRLLFDRDQRSKRTEPA